MEKQTLVTGGIGRGIGGKERLLAGCLDTMLRYPYGLGVATERGKELVSAEIHVRDEKKRPTPPEKRSRHQGLGSVTAVWPSVTFLLSASFYVSG